MRDLVALSALPSLWAARPIAGVVDSFLDVLVAGLRLDFAYARVADPRGKRTIEAARTGANRDSLDLDHTRRIADAFAPYLSNVGPATIANPIGSGSLRILVLRLGMAKAGDVVIASHRAEFPTDVDSMIITAAANQMQVWLRMDRLQLARRRAEATLEHRELEQREHENLFLHVRELREEADIARTFGGIVGDSGVLKDILDQVVLVAPTDATVLLLGESGTGKELFAREIHERSRRRDGPLIRVNSSAIPREMFESEFFGHVRGAFSGAVRDRPGRFQLAHKGTIFLDEVSDLPIDMQPKLLRVLQEQQYERVGDDSTRQVDVRVIAATNRDLRAEIAAGHFREDLYYRIGVFPIQIPPLRDRADDIPILALHFARLVAKQLGIGEPRIDPQQLAVLQSYGWPGNVRELENVIERSVILAHGANLRFEELLPSQTRSLSTPSFPSLRSRDDASSDVISDEEWRRLERANLLAALDRADGKIYGAGGAAELLGIKPSRLRALQIARPRR